MGCRAHVLGTTRPRRPPMPGLGGSGRCCRSCRHGASLGSTKVCGPVLSGGAWLITKSVSPDGVSKGCMGRRSIWGCRCLGPKLRYNRLEASWMILFSLSIHVVKTMRTQNLIYFGIIVHIRGVSHQGHTMCWAASVLWTSSV